MFPTFLSSSIILSWNEKIAQDSESSILLACLFQNMFLISWSGRNAFLQYFFCFTQLSIFFLMQEHTRYYYFCMESLRFMCKIQSDMISVHYKFIHSNFGGSSIAKFMRNNLSLSYFTKHQNKTLMMLCRRMLILSRSR